MVPFVADTSASSLFLDFGIFLLPLTRTNSAKCLRSSVTSVLHHLRVANIRKFTLYMIPFQSFFGVTKFSTYAFFMSFISL